MKKYFFLLMLVLTSCSDQQVMDEVVATEPAAISPENEITVLMGKARCGDGHAYLKLADCYNNGIGVKKDALSVLCMVSLAKKYDAISNFDEYFSKLPEDNESRLLYEIMDHTLSDKDSLSDSLVSRLARINSPELYTARGMLAIERGDTTRGFSLMRMAAEQGSSLGALLTCISDFKKMKTIAERLTAIADKVPVAYFILGDIYTGKEDLDIKDERLAAYYYMKADEHAMLGDRAARWLLNYHRSGGDIHLSESDIQRLRTISCMDYWEQQEQQENVCDSVAADSVVINE